jgi:fructose 1,6-bisphosphate aldolase/phosphatase
VKITLSAIKADIGSIGGHIKPSERVLEAVKTHIREHAGDLVVDHYISHAGDDIAILMTHWRGEGDEQIHRLAWEAFRAGTAAAIGQGLYAARHDLLKGFYSRDIRSMGTVAAEIEFEERSSEPFLFFAADKTDQGAFNLPLYLAFADVMNTPGLILSPMMSKGFRFVITDVSCDEGDREIELNAPEELYDIAALLRDSERYVVKSIWSRTTGEQAVAVAASRLPKYRRQTHTGKDDPVMLVRVQMNFPATGEVLAPYAIGHFVGGCMRGSHQMPLMPVPLNTPVSYFDGPPIVTCAGFAERHGEFTEPVDCFMHPFWDTVRQHVATKAIEMRRQGFVGAAMLPVSELEYRGVQPELEYTGIMAKLKMLDGRFIVRPSVSLPVPA